MRKIIFALTALLCAGLVTLLSNKQETNAAVMRPGEMVGVGEAMIGGNFTLVDQQGKTVKDSDFRGRLMLVFFGFTHCPDICPVSTKTLSDAMGLLGDKADQVAPIFISVDPERDTPPVMKDYFSNFDSRMIALTGDAEQIRQVAGAYKAYYSKHEPKAESHDEGHDHYTVDHSGFIYLMDRDGKYVTHFPYDASAQSIVETVKPLLK